MNYEKKYKALLEQAKETLKACGSLDCDAAKQILRFFPELEESDYVIKRRLKYLLGYFRSRGIDHATCDRIQNWLEKQDEQMIAKGERMNVALSIINYLDDNRVAGCMDLSSMECEDIEDACVNSKWTKLYNYMKKKLETPDVSDYNPYEATVKSIIAMTERYANGNDLQNFYDNVKVKCKEAVDYDKTWLEKTSRQESTDKLKQGFKVGDWVVQKDGDTFYGGARTVQISKIEDDRIWFTSETWLTSDYIRHWNIDDAKDGDVLVSSSDKPFIYNGHFNEDNVYAYCGIDLEDNFIIAHMRYSWTKKENIKPATKKQQDYLFQKMEEAGYIWDDHAKMMITHMKSK